MNSSLVQRRFGMDLATSWIGAVLLPWTLSRGLLYVLAQGTAALRGRSGFAAWSVWDSAWYVRIAQDGYGFVSSRGETPYPFFPLLPALLRGGEGLGLSPLATGVLLSHVAFLIALWGVYDITRAHGSAREAALASWCLAFYPGSAALTLVYPCAIFLACAVWGFRAVERGRDGSAALLAAAAAMVRPNGAVLAMSLAVAAWCADGSWRRALRVVLPAAAAVAAWLAWLYAETGDALVFLHAKDAWHEVTLASLLAGTDRVPKLDVAPVAFAVVVLALSWRRLPAAWLLFVALALLPSLALGMLGMPRYTAACFPLFVAAGIVLARLPGAVCVAALTGSAGALLFLAQRIFLSEHMP